MGIQPLADPASRCTWIPPMTLSAVAREVSRSRSASCRRMANETRDHAAQGSGLAAVLHLRDRRGRRELGGDRLGQDTGKEVGELVVGVQGKDVRDVLVGPDDDDAAG